MAAWWGPKKVPAKVAPKPVVKAATKGAPTSTTGRPRLSKPVTVDRTKVSFYDQSRIIDPERLKVVKDLRERGDVQAGDSGHLGPGSTGGAFARPVVSRPVAAPQPAKQGLTKGQLAALAAIGYLLLGG